MTAPDPVRDAALAAVDAYAADQAKQAAVAQQATDQVTIDSLTATVASDTSELAADAATIAELQAQVAALTPKPPTLFGADPGPHAGETAAAALTRVEAALGTLQVVRVYDSADGAAKALSVATSMNVAGRSIASFKRDYAGVMAGTYDAEITALVKAVKYWCIWHEPDQQGRPFTPPQFVQMWQHIHGLAVKAGATSRACLILTGDDLVDRLPTWYPGDAYVDVIAVDPYSHATTDTAQSLFTPHLTVIAKTGKPAAIAETGCKYTDPATVTGFVTSFSWLKTQTICPVEFVSWFDTTAAGVDYSISGIPTAAAAYKALPN